MVVSESALNQAPHISAEIRPVTKEEYPQYIPQLSSIYNHWSPQFNGTFVRSEVAALPADLHMFVADPPAGVLAHVGGSCYSP